MDKGEVHVGLLQSGHREEDDGGGSIRRPKLYEWQRRKLRRIAELRNRHKNPCCLGFGCLVCAWSVVTLLVTLVCYARLSQSLNLGQMYKVFNGAVYTPIKVAYQRYTTNKFHTGFGKGYVGWYIFILTEKQKSLSLKPIK